MLLKFGNSLLKFGSSLVDFSEETIDPEGITFLTSYDAGYQKIESYIGEGANYRIPFRVLEPDTDIVLETFTVCDGHSSQYGYDSSVSSTPKIVDTIFYNKLSDTYTDLSTWKTAASDFTLSNMGSGDKEDDYYIHTYTLSSSITLKRGYRYFIPCIGNNSKEAENLIVYTTSSPTVTARYVLVNYDGIDDYFTAANIASYGYGVFTRYDGQHIALKLNGENV